MKCAGRRSLLDTESNRRAAAAENRGAVSRQTSPTFSLEGLAPDLSLSDSLEALVRHAEQIHPESLVSIMLMDETGEHLLSGASPSLPDAFDQAVSGSAVGPDAGPCGTAAYGNRLVVVEDIQSDPLWTNVKPLAEKIGVRACWSQPIRGMAGRVLGVIAIYHRDARSPTGLQLHSVQNLSILASNIIDRHAAQLATAEIERRLSETSSRLTDMER
ncbi:MAG TPA: hypothetical protein DCX75_15760, partial [Brevundimonas sp.]|nr:hypothetical protein [Brevundimonas sp.]